MRSKVAGLIPEGTHAGIIDALVRARPANPNAAGDTTLLCYGAIDLCGGNKVQRNSGKRIIESVFRRNGISDRRRVRFTKLIEMAKKTQVAEYLLLLQPYKETKSWLKTETG